MENNVTAQKPKDPIDKSSLLKRFAELPPMVQASLLAGIEVGIAAMKTDKQ